jgi:hypothetical protein
MEQTTIQPTAVCITSLVADVRGFSAFSQKDRFRTGLHPHQGDLLSIQHHRERAPGHGQGLCRRCGLRLLGAPAWFLHRPCAGRLPGRHQPVTQRSGNPPATDERGILLPPPLLGWGLTTGQVTLSHYGARSAGMALVGDCINLAFRLSSMANKTLSAPIVLCRQTASWVTQKLPLMDLGDRKFGAERARAPFRYPAGVNHPF